VTSVKHIKREEKKENVTIEEALQISSESTICMFAQHVSVLGHTNKMRYSDFPIFSMIHFILKRNLQSANSCALPSSLSFSLAHNMSKDQLEKSVYSKYSVREKMSF
jgi:hypothetical protein